GCFSIAPRTLARRLQQWDIRRLPSKTFGNKALCGRICSLVYENYSDPEILQRLHSEGFQISSITFKRLRQQLDLRLRTDNPEAQCIQDNQIAEVLRQEIQGGSIESYGRCLLHTHPREKCHIFPRILDLQRQRQAYQSPGPNYVWHMDGYMKLSLYGIEIYAAIDGYSRYILWVYIGLSTRTAISVYKQYIEADFGYIPQILRTDLGGETIYLGDAHWARRRVAYPDIPHADCYSYGKSTENTRIEAWWGQLSRSSLFLWRNYFAALRDEGLFSITSIPDQIALLAIYMPILRSNIDSYVRTWNRHRIRKQPKRPWVVAGKPIVLYNNARQHIKQLADPTLFETLRQDVANWDVDEYLPLDTLGWCIHQLEEIEFNPLNPPPRDDPAQPYKSIYLELR
ncbi:hypothetical protein N7507_010405, partial [Penicillium longicatenatum]